MLVNAANGDDVDTNSGGRSIPQPICAVVASCNRQDPFLAINPTRNDTRQWFGPAIGIAGIVGDDVVVILEGTKELIDMNIVGDGAVTSENTASIDSECVSNTGGFVRTSVDDSCNAGTGTIALIERIII